MTAAAASDVAASPAVSPDTTAGIGTVLVAFASAHGSTQGVADRIAARLRERGVQVVSRPVDDISDLGPYDAVILGSAVYSQSWIQTASSFLREHADALARRRVWLFSVGSFGDTHRVIGRLMKKEPHDIEEFYKAVHPREYRVFAGAIQRNQWPPISRVFFHAFGGRFGDNRDWLAIDSWADTIAQSLMASKTGASPGDQP
jgi:menaquinone-dependent protoporphyrinogen oxidase